MRKIPLLAAAAGFAAAVAMPFFLTTGCDPANDYEIRITPAYAELTKNNPEVRLTAHGWSDYNWSIDKPGIGRLSATHGESVVYSVNGEVTDDVQIVRVTGRNANSPASGAGSGTNTSSAVTYSGSARIAHVAGNTAEAYTQVSPTWAEVSKIGQSVTFRATGGSEYTWALTRPELGRLSSSRGNSVTYTATLIPPAGLTVGGNTALPAKYAIINGTNTVVEAETYQTITVTGATPAGTDTARVRHLWKLNP